MGSKARTIGLAALAGLLSSSLAWADPGQKPALGAPAKVKSAPLKTKRTWPKALKFRNARYADLQRVDDVKGDEREQMFHTAYLKRVDDRLGDLEEARRYRAWSGKQKKLVRFANVTRDPGLAGDREEQKLSRMSLARKAADFRRRGIIRAEELPEIQAYNRDRLIYGDLNRKIGLADNNVDAKGAANRLNRDLRRNTSGKARQKERREDDDEVRRDGRRRGGFIRDDPSKLAGADEARDDAKAEARLDAILERGEDRKNAREEAKAEERNEKAAERGDEQNAERELERAEEKTVLQEEEQEED